MKLYLLCCTDFFVSLFSHLSPDSDWYLSQSSNHFALQQRFQTQQEDEALECSLNTSPGDPFALWQIILPPSSFTH